MFIDVQIYFLGLLLMIILVIPIFIHLYYVRKPKIDYNAKYETDLPTDDPPAIVNAICAGDPEIMGVPNLDGFRATILDLIDRNYIFLNESGENNHSKKLFLEINPDYDISSLWGFEIGVLEFLKEHEDNGSISMNLISNSLDYYDSSDLSSYTYDEWHKAFESKINAYKKWEIEVEKTLIDENNFKDAFISKDRKYLKILGIFGTIIAWGFIFYFASFKLYSAILMLLALILWLESIIVFLLPERITCRWTPYGLEYYERWMNFKRYIKDFSLITEYPPESVKIWDKYLIYATALGAAHGVRRAMELSLPEKKLKKSDMYLYHFHENQES